MTPSSAGPAAASLALVPADGGIGLGSRACSLRRADLVLVARSPTARRAAFDLSIAHGVDVRSRCDLSDRAAPATVAGAVGARRLKVLVNNAGYATWGRFAELDRDRELAMIDVNVRALTELTHRFLPGMLERGGGRILNVASTAAFFSGPLMATYYATKNYVLAFSEAVAEEVAGSGRHRHGALPGPTRSGFQARAGMETSRLVKGRSLMPPTRSPAPSGTAPGPAVAS